MVHFAQNRREKKTFKVIQIKGPNTTSRTAITFWNVDPNFDFD